MRDKGFTLIEVIVAVAIVSIMAGIIIPSVYQFWIGNEVSLTRQRMAELKKAMVGDRSLVQNGIRTHFGFVGEFGELPLTLEDLVNNDRGSYTAWSGPYLAPGFDAGMFGKDAWGNPIIYTPEADGSGRLCRATLKSAGPDLIPGTADDIAEAALQISDRDVTPTAALQGNISFVFSAYSSPSRNYGAKVSAEAAGGMNVSTDGCIPVSTGVVKAGQVSTVAVSFSSSFPVKLPVGRVNMRSDLYADGACGTPVATSTNLAVFVNDGINVIPVNLPAINYTIP